MPHLSALVERHKDDPFVLIGVNHGDDPEAFKKGLKDFNVSWITAYQMAGKEAITNLFQVSGFPTYYLIGPDGKILGKGHDGTAYDKKIATLVEEIKKKNEQ